MLLGEGLEGCEDYLGFALELLKKHRQKAFDRLSANLSTVSTENKVFNYLMSSTARLIHCATV